MPLHGILFLFLERSLWLYDPMLSDAKNFTDPLRALDPLLGGNAAKTYGFGDVCGG